MTYQETIDYLFNVTPVFEHQGASAYKEGLENTLALDEHFGHPHRQYKTIHVAGTNGKGSCSHTIASVLQEAGYKVGLYTSPHLVDFRERIKVNGHCISEEEVVAFVEDFTQWNCSGCEVQGARCEDSFTANSISNNTNLVPRTSNLEPRIYPSFFELTTALAFRHFADQQVDIAVIEVGLGGRLDCTNIISPILSVITNISFDHTGFLGDTLAKIASEKAGIIKHGVPVVIGEYTDETRPVFEAKARELDAPIVFAQDLPELGADIDFELKGDYQMRNKQTVLAALCTLQEGERARGRESEDSSIGKKIGCETNLALSSSRSLALSPSPLLPPSTIKKGFAHVCENTGLMGRWQTIREQPKVVCDTGHNVGGWQYLSKQIAAQPCKQLRIVFGMVDDKDIDTVMELLPKHATYYWTQADNHRAIPAERVAAIGQAHQLNGKLYNKVADAYHAALHEADAADFIFVGGSSYVVADFLKSL